MLVLPTKKDWIMAPKGRNSKGAKEEDIFNIDIGIDFETLRAREDEGTGTLKRNSRQLL